jgi:HEAT repeat protein
MGLPAVTWLAYTVEHGRHPYVEPALHLFDRFPLWLRHRLPDRWGGLRVSAQFDERVAAAYALWVLGPKAAPAIPALARGLESNSKELAYWSASSLHAIGPASWPVVDRALVHRDSLVRAAVVANMYGRFPVDGDPVSNIEITRVAQALNKACRDPNAEVRAAAAEAIINCKNEVQETNGFDITIPFLIQLLSDSAAVRGSAYRALDSFREKAAPAIPVLAEILKGGDLESVRDAADLLHSIGPLSWPVVEEALASGKPDTRSSLVTLILHRLIPKNEQPVSDDEFVRVYEALIRALKKIPMLKCGS